MENFWAGVGAAAAVVAVIFAWLQYRALKTGLVAQIESHEYSPPVYLTNGPAALYDQIMRGEVLRDVVDVEAERVHQLEDKIIQRMQEIFPREALSGFHHLRRYWRVTVTNRGHTTAEAVALKIPHAHLARITREGIEPREQKISVLIELGDVRPGEEIAVEAWSDHTGRLQDARIVQKNGRAKIVRRELVGPFWVWLSDTWGVLIFTLFMLTYAVLLLISSLGRDRSEIPTQRPDSVTTDSQKPPHVTGPGG